MPNNSRNTTTDHVEDLEEINPLTDLTESQRQQQKIQCIYNIDNPLDINTLPNCVTIHDTDNQLDTLTLPNCVTIHNVDNQLDINTLLNCVTNHEKRRATHSVQKETPVNDHTLSDRVINRGKQNVARSRETNNFANNLDQQKTRNKNISTDPRQTLANDSNIYLVEQVKKHLHRNEKPEFLIKSLDYLNRQIKWNPEDHLPPALVQEYFQQSPLEKPPPTNAVFPTFYPESLLDGHIHANYSDYSNSCRIPHSLPLQASLWKAGRVFCFT